LALGLASASASLSISYSGTPQTIPDGSSVGITSVATVSGAGPSLSSVGVTLNLSGGNIGDLVAYLSYDGVTEQLLNRPGTGGNPLALGYTGMSFTSPFSLSDSGTGSIDSYGGTATSGTYQPSVSFSAFNGLNPNGNWTLFFADLSGGDGANVTTLNGWSLIITAVPEPVNVAMAIFGAGIIGVGAARYYSSSRKARL
jgi:subtilisin-like proprotein convertase family protein